MINAYEHEKLLARITELEKNSVNYFDVEKEFFLIDSNNLSQVRPRLYGYSIQQSGIYEDENLTPEAVAGLDGRGCYVYVDVQDGKITIKQDLNGCWGIYLFRHDDYFALSNSFFRLLDHVKFRYPLTVNRDYCHYFMVNSVSSYACKETAVNEIQLVEKNAILQLDIAKKDLQVELINYQEYTLRLDSKEGIATLDNWVEFWSSVLRGIAQHTKFISADLSGGFDTRVSLLFLMHSGIGYKKMRIHSVKSEQFIFPEDYAIASQISEHYNFKLNQSLPARQFLNYSLADTWNADLYHQQTFRLLQHLWIKKPVDKLYYLKGLSGETIRGYLHKPTKKFISEQLGKTTHFSSILSNTLSDSIKNILESGFRTIQDKYNIEDKDSPYIPQYLYQEIRARNHYGKESLGCYLENTITISPALDPKIRTLQLDTPECQDLRLLVALLFTRYEPDLLMFPFEANRSIAPETIEYAKKINERFPLVNKDKLSVSGGGFCLQPRDTQAEKILSSGRNNPAIPGGLPGACLKATFESSKTYGLFTSHFDEELYHYAAAYYDTHDFGRDRPMYAIVGVTKVLEDVKISQRNYPKYQDMKRFLEQDFVKIHKDDQVLVKFKNYFTARIDVKLISTTGDFQILFVSDEKASVQKPGWFQHGGIGYQIQSYAGKLEFVAKATVDSRIVLDLLGLDIRTPEDNSKRIPYWVDYTKLTVNGKVIFDNLTPAWHDKLYHHIIDAKANAEVKIQIEWLPHRSDT